MVPRRSDNPPQASASSYKACEMICERGRGFFGRLFKAFHISSTIFASYIPFSLCLRFQPGYHVFVEGSVGALPQPDDGSAHGVPMADCAPGDTEPCGYPCQAVKEFLIAHSPLHVSLGPLPRRWTFAILGNGRRKPDKTMFP